MPALAIRKAQDEAEARPARRALGPSERPASALQMLLAIDQRSAVPTVERSPLLGDVLSHELLDMLLAGGPALGEALLLVHEGKPGQAIAKLVQAGIALAHAKEAVELLAAVARHGIRSLVAGAEVAGGAGIGCALFQVAGLVGIREAHMFGDAKAAMAVYAHTFARIVTELLFCDRGAPPATFPHAERSPLPHLDEAGQRARQDAARVLRSLHGSAADELAGALLDEHGSVKGVEVAIREALMREAGLSGYVPSGPPVR
jgi:hypothetical protein